MQQQRKLTDYLIAESATIEAAMQQLNETTVKTLYVVDEVSRLVGSLNDGDMRRGILCGGELKDEVTKWMNQAPKHLQNTTSELKQRAQEMLLQYDIESLPVLNMKKQVCSVITWEEAFVPADQVYEAKRNKVFVLAGGKGTRLEPFTKILPKPLIPVGEQPILERIMDRFAFYGFDKFIVSLNYKAEMIKLYFSDKDIRSKYSDISYVEESVPLGTIGSLTLARDEICDSFFISNADILIESDLEKIFQYHKKAGGLLTIVGCVKDDVLPYGVLNTDEKGFLTAFQEKPTYKNVINTGVYVAEPGILDYLEDDKYQDITDIIARLMEKGEKIGVYPVFQDQWFDIGQWAEYEKTRKHFER